MIRTKKDIKRFVDRWCEFCGIRRLVKRRDAKTCGHKKCIKARRMVRYEKTYRKNKIKLRKQWKLAKRKQRKRDKD